MQRTDIAEIILVEDWEYKEKAEIRESKRRSVIIEVLNHRADMCWAELVLWSLLLGDRYDPNEYPEGYKTTDCDYCGKCQGIREEWIRPIYPKESYD